MATEVSKNDDGTWHAPGAGDHRTKAEATAALDAHQQELQQAREQRSRDNADAGNGTGHPGSHDDVQNMSPQELDDYTGNVTVQPRPARRADISGQGRQLDALGNPVS